MTRARRWVISFLLASLLAGCGSGTTQRLLTDQDPTESPAIATETGADPQLTQRFEATERPVEYWIQQFEAESREVYNRRRDIVGALELQPGMHLADIGAGTGAFEPLLVDEVGAQGRVYAVDISPRFLEHLRGLARAAGWSNVLVVKASETSSNLAPGSVDVVFSVATYHHFTHVKETLASLHRALRPGGRMVIVDFRRIPGVSSDWVLEHVRAGVETVRAEIEAAGFEFTRSIDILEDNFMIEFRRG